MDGAQGGREWGWDNGREAGSVTDTPNFCVYSQVPSIKYPHYLLEKERKRERGGERERKRKSGKGKRIGEEGGRKEGMRPGSQDFLWCKGYVHLTGEKLEAQGSKERSSPSILNWF